MRKLSILCVFLVIGGCQAVPDKFVETTKQFRRVTDEDYVSVTQVLLKKEIARLKLEQMEADSEEEKEKLQEKIDKYKRARNTGEEIIETFDWQIRTLEEFSRKWSL